MQLWFLVLAVISTVDADPMAPCALVLKVQGRIYRERDKVSQPLRELDLLRPGDVVVTDDGGGILAFLEDGRRERVKPKSRATIGSKSCTPAEAIDKLDQVPLTPAHLQGLRELARSNRAAFSALRDGDMPVARPAVSPLFGAAILIQTPTFLWPAVARAESYEVELRSADDQRRIWLVSCKENKLQYPRQESGVGGTPIEPLKHEEKYHWRVTARSKDAPLGKPIESQFIVLPKTEIESSKPLEKLAAANDPTHWLLAAMTYESLGAWGEALPLYEKLAKQAPNELNYQIVLANLYERAGMLDRAEAAKAKAKELGVGRP